MDKNERTKKKEAKYVVWSLLVILGYFLVYLGIAVFNFIG